jgi:hypothetical protein
MENIFISNKSFSNIFKCLEWIKTEVFLFKNIYYTKLKLMKKNLLSLIQNYSISQIWFPDMNLDFLKKQHRYTFGIRIKNTLDLIAKSLVFNILHSP